MDERKEGGRGGIVKEDIGAGGGCGPDRVCEGTI